MLPFSKATYVGSEDEFVLSAMHSRSISGDGKYSKFCENWFENKLLCKKALLTPSCTHALELAALLIDTQPGDEIIMPSYTFVSTANAFVLRGAKIVFVDIRPDTMNIDEKLLEAAITHKTKAIVPVHYAGVSCEMSTIMAIAKRHQIFVIEDAAQGMMSTYKGRALGSIGHFGAISFHETKNFTSGGEGGLLIINDEQFIERAEIIREKGTNRKQFLQGVVDKYSWVDIGSSYLPSEIQAAYLWGQLERADHINEDRLRIWEKYSQGFRSLAKTGKVQLPSIPKDCKHNAHIYYLKVNSIDERRALLDFLRKQNVQATFHYVPLHSAVASARYGKFSGADKLTTSESERLVRIPIWYGMREAEVEQVIQAVLNYFKNEDLCN